METIFFIVSYLFRSIYPRNDAVKLILVLVSQSRDHNFYKQQLQIFMIDRFMRWDIMKSGKLILIMSTIREC